MSKLIQDARFAGALAASVEHLRGDRVLGGRAHSGDGDSPRSGSGRAGMAYWIMLAVVASGVVGRYLYAQIPRSKKDAELSLTELEKMHALLSKELHNQKLFDENELRPVVMPIDRKEALRMALPIALWRMFTLDVSRPFVMASLRWHA